MSVGRGGSRSARSGAALTLVGDTTRRARDSHAEPARGVYVALDALRHALDGADWAPLHLAAGRSTRPASPRLPHALALHLAHAARTTADADALAPDRPRLAALLATDTARLDGALDALTRAGVVAGGPDRVRLTPAVLGPAPRCAALDWAALADATVGSPSAWVAAHALAERLERHHWTPVPRADLEQTLGAGASGARAALDRLVTSGVVERREQRGGVSVYRFADACWTDATGPALGSAVVPARRTPDPSAALPTPRPAPGPTRAPAASAGAGPVATALPAPGLRLVVGGVVVEVPAGMRACVEVGADGRPTLTLLPAD